MCNVTDDEAQGNFLYPYGNATYTLTDPNTNSTNTTTRIEVPCSKQDVDATVLRECPSPLALSEEGRCGFACPLPALSDSQYDDIKILQGTVGWISWVTSSILVTSYAANPALRKFPKHLILMVSIAANIAAGGIILPSMVGYHNMWCGGQDKVNVPTVAVKLLPPSSITASVIFEEQTLLFGSSACTFQGAVLLFAFLAAVAWWALIALNMCLELYLPRNMEWLDSPWWKWSRIVIYQTIGWGIPFLFMVITAGADRLKFSSGASYCFISGEEDKRYQLAFWFIPVGMFLLMGFILFMMALLRLTVGAIKVSKAKMFIFLYYRLLLFIFFYLILFTFIFAYNIQIEANSADIQTGFQDYYNCLVLNGACSLSDSVSNYDLIMLRGFAISALGFFLFLTFLSWDIIRFWYSFGRRLVLLIIKREQRHGHAALRMFIAETATPSVSDDVTLTVAGSMTMQEKEEEHEPSPRTKEEMTEDDSLSSS